jgi:hypothetical protein
MRSRCRCSMCPAIHINSRSWLRSSSTHEPSDPPQRVVFRLTGCLPSAQDGRSPAPQWRGLSVFKCDDTTRDARCENNGTGRRRSTPMRGCPRNEQPLFKPSPRVRGSACERVGTPQRSRRFLTRSVRQRRCRHVGRGRCLPRPSPDGTARRAERSLVFASQPALRRECALRFVFWFVTPLPETTKHTVMIHPQVHLRIPCYDFYFLYSGQFAHLLGTPRASREGPAYGTNSKSSLTGAIGSSDGRCVQRAGT